MGKIGKMLELIRIKLRLTNEEKQACLMLSQLQCDLNTGRFVKNEYNDYVLEQARCKLGGRDPIEFVKAIFSGKSWKNDGLAELYDDLRG